MLSAMSSKPLTRTLNPGTVMFIAMMSNSGIPCQISASGLKSEMIKTLGLITYSKDLSWISALGTRAAVTTEAKASSTAGIEDNMMAFLFHPKKN
jgi:hypothetical protein